MRILRSLIVLCTALSAMVAVGQAAGPTAAETPRTAVKAAVTTAAKPKPPDHYQVPAGVKFNEPYNRNHRHWYNIRRHIIRTINSTTKGDHIRFASWNIRGRAYTDALIRAHKRGVGVGVILDWTNANPTFPNPDVNRLGHALAVGNAKRPLADRSFLVKCHSSCRGGHGIAHLKFFLFDHVGAKSWITMYGSNNATDVAAHSQWNDLETFDNNKRIYDAFNTIFGQMRQDRSRGRRTFQSFDISKNISFNFYPNSRPSPADPDLARLKQVRCTGATGGAGFHGHTKLRISQDAILGARGIKIAHRLVRMKRQGCDIRLIYSLLSRQVRKILNDGGVPMLQYSYDRNRDGMYDIYLHMKVIAISGVFRGKHNARVTFNGTANWSPVALVSDEVVGRIASRKITQEYMNEIDFLFNHRPRSWGPVNLGRPRVNARLALHPVLNWEGRPTGRLTTKVDPYALMKREGL